MYRLSAGRDAKKVADKPYRFCYRTHKDNNAIVVPQTTTERRSYLPVGISTPDTVISAKGFAIYNMDMFIFGLLSSRMHHIWMATTSGKPAGGGYAYSVKLTYNTFPIPIFSQELRGMVIEKAFKLLEVRETFPNKTLSQLYRLDVMPEALVVAHKELDEVIESGYSKKEMHSDEQRLKLLFRLYKQSISGDKNA